MDFLFEIFIQVFVEFLMELLGHAFGRLFRSVGSVLGRRAGGWAMGLLLGIAGGFLWGGHLAGEFTWPKLFWVSLTLGIAAFALGVLRSGAWPDEPRAASWRQLLIAPWHWDTERLYGFALINLGIVIGIAWGFGPSWAPPG